MRFLHAVCITIQTGRIILICLRQMREMLNQTEIERIRRYINGMADAADLEWIEEFFAHGHQNQQLKHLLEDDWGSILREPHLEDVNLDHILSQVHHAIREKQSQQGKKKTFVHRMRTIYVKAAAILLLPLILAGSLYVGYFKDLSMIITGQQASTAIYAPMGSRVSFNLPDGTKGFLNSGSTLTYSLPFNESRKVALEGEAWFDVFHNEKHPFEIAAGESKITVLGTSFNLNAYPDEAYLQVILQSGKVEFSNRRQKEKVVLKPSEQLTLQDGNLKISSVDVSKYKAWTDGRLIFRGDNMAEVVRRIERWYNVEVEIADNDLMQFSFRATFENDSLEDVLKQLSMTSPIEYEILPRKQLPDGTSEKKKAILYKKRI